MSLKQSINLEDLVSRINLAYEAVNLSKIGPIFKKSGNIEIFNSLAASTFMTVLTNIIQKEAMQYEVVPPEEEWEKEN